MSKQRYEKEIEEILQKYDEQSGRKDRPPRDTPDARDARNPVAPRDARLPSSKPLDFRAPQRPSRPASQRGFSMPNWKRLGSGQYILLAFGAALLAVVLRNVLPDIFIIALIVLSAIFFLIPIVLYSNTGNTSGGYSPHEEKHWRGQVIDFSTRRDVSNDPLESIKRWFRRK